MEGSASSINSRSTAIKTILLTAWKNKLSQDEWSAKIKKVLPRGVNGDVYDLADCLLKQALVGPVPNQLFMSYLKHAVQCELVSHGAVLCSISNQSVNVRQTNGSPSRILSITCLIEFLKSFRDKISCKETELECLSLCHSLGLLINWLLKCIQSSAETYLIVAQTLQQKKKALQQSKANSMNAPNSGSINIMNQQLESIIGIIDICSEMIHYFINRPFTKSLLFICKIEYSNSLFDEINKLLQSIQLTISSSPSLQSHIQEKSPYFIALHQFNITFNSLDHHPSVVAAEQLRSVQMNRIRSTQAVCSTSFEKKIKLQKQQQQQPQEPLKPQSQQQSDPDITQTPPTGSGGSSHQSVNGKFISTLSTYEIFMSNLMPCLSRGSIDDKSLDSLSSLHKLIGSECFTNLIVEQILISHESPSDLSRAINITFDLFNIDIEACCLALLNNTIPDWLMVEKKQSLLTQPRAFALAYLAVMTIVEVHNNLGSMKSSHETCANPTSAALASNNINNNIEETAALSARLNVNGIKQEPGLQSSGNSSSSSVNGPKMMKVTMPDDDVTLNSNQQQQFQQQEVVGKLEKLNNSVANLMRLFKQILSDPVMSHRSLFPILFLEQTVVCTRERASAITAHLQPEILLDIINLFSSELTFELVLAISNLSSTESREFAAKAICKLAQIKESKHKSEPPILASLASSSSSGPPTQQPMLGSSSGTPSTSSDDGGGGGKSLMSSATPMIIG